MQTFLPVPSFVESARCLDDKRLGKQRIEAYQILRTLLGLTEGWRHHPAVKMWRGHEMRLYIYAVIICMEWIRRGFRDSMLDRLLSEEDICGKLKTVTGMPDWFGNADFHRSHQSNLLRKDPKHYSQFGWDVPADLPYVWPKGKGD